MTTILKITDDQANSLLDLVNDQIRSQRRQLRRTPLHATNISALAHFRNLKRLILEDERARMRATADDYELQEDIKFIALMRKKQGEPASR